MKILVINGSPRAEKSNTTVLTDAFLAGAAEAGAQSEVVYLANKQITHCCGNFICWTETPGACIHEDDMGELLEKMRKADLMVIATPLYIYNMTGMIKTFLDRILPLVQPTIEIQAGRSSHPYRHPDQHTRFLLLSNCGFVEQSNFTGLKETMRCWFQADPDGLAGMICCSGGELLQVPDLQEGIGWYLDAVRQAGREIASGGKISHATQAELDKPLVPDRDLFVKMANIHFESALSGKRPNSQGDIKLTAGFSPQVAGLSDLSSMADLLNGMSQALDPVAAGSLCATIQFVVTDEAPDAYYLSIARGACTCHAGHTTNPTLTITTPSSVWLGIVRGQISGEAAFLTGRYKVQGDIRLLMRLEKLFVRAPAR